MRTMTRTIMTLALAALLTGSAFAAPASSGAAGKVNINTASVEQLQLLPRVGPALAQRIVEFRTANGAFKAPEELIAVRGIGEKSFANLKPYVAVQGDTTLKEKVRLPRQTQDKAQK
ncbi:MAG: helix-hairpin-helix domain-containing protein [Acidobacteriota bacterium]